MRNAANASIEFGFLGVEVGIIDGGAFPFDWLEGELCAVAYLRPPSTEQHLP
jgi:hypothetical protein